MAETAGDPSRTEHNTRRSQCATPLPDADIFTSHEIQGRYFYDDRSGSNTAERAYSVKKISTRPSQSRPFCVVFVWAALFSKCTLKPGKRRGAIMAVRRRFLAKPPPNVA